MSFNSPRPQGELKHAIARQRPAKLKKRGMTVSKPEDKHISFAPEEIPEARHYNLDHSETVDDALDNDVPKRPSEPRKPRGVKLTVDTAFGNDVAKGPAEPHGPKGAKFVANKDVTFEDLAKRGVIPKSALISKRWFSS